MKSIKTLGVAIVMAFALTAFAGVGSASANWFKTSIEPTTWNGSLTGKKHQLIVGETFQCSGVSFSGTATLKANSELTVTPELTSCSWIGLPTGWAVNGCKYRFRPGAGPALVGTVDIVNCNEPMMFAASGCVIEIGNQKGLGTVTYKNVIVGGISTITAVAQLNSITYTSKGCFSSSGTFSNGVYSGEWTVKGTASPGGPQVPVEVESTSAAPFTKFVADEAPATLSGTGTGATTRMKPMGGNLLVCNKYSLSGTSASASTEALTLTPSYKECSVGGEAVPDNFVSAGGCSYVFHANGKFDIAGATCASNPITLTRAGCVVTIGPQSGLSGFSFTNEGSGKLRTVAMSGETGQKVAGTSAGPNCGSEGAFSTGNIRSSAKLTATNAGGALQGFSMG